MVERKTFTYFFDGRGMTQADAEKATRDCATAQVDKIAAAHGYRLVGEISVSKTAGTVWRAAASLECSDACRSAV